MHSASKNEFPYLAWQGPPATTSPTSPSMAGSSGGGANTAKAPVSSIIFGRFCNAASFMSAGIFATMGARCAGQSSSGGAPAQSAPVLAALTQSNKRLRRRCTTSPASSDGTFNFTAPDSSARTFAPPASRPTAAPRAWSLALKAAATSQPMLTGSRLCQPSPAASNSEATSSPGADQDESAAPSPHPEPSACEASPPPAAPPSAAPPEPPPPSAAAGASVAIWTSASGNSASLPSYFHFTRTIPKLLIGSSMVASWRSSPYLARTS
mmetsp:Transcript_124637/g.357991  ORF Transcript_124637/g.357991 Transcript_124637/m.357991 type:complete len:267 (-) Transcript_124637:791-1591(-)